MSIALIAGHTGLVGRHLLDQLLHDPRYTEVKAVGRRAPAQTHPRLRAIQTELGALGKLGAALAADDAYCCLGTTLKAAGSRAAFERVDYHMVVDFARAAHAAGARRFFLVSSLSANPRSPVYYSRIKGRAEQAVREVGFESVVILRPSLLLGERQEHRLGEAVAQRVAPLINPLLRGPWTRYRAVQASDVARALVGLSQQEQPGVRLHHLPLDSQADIRLSA